MKASQQTLLALAIIQGAQAWGSLGHQTIAYIAQHYISNHTASWAQSILNDTSSHYLANIATWADGYRYTAEGKFSAGFHYIDAKDNPPETCNVDFERDCSEEGCVVSAIANYTQRVQATELDMLQRDYALRWIVHFCGDISQPLHDENFHMGGNGVHVTFNGSETNLHGVWDTYMAEELRGGYGLIEAQLWASDLVKEIDAGTYKAQSKAWLQGIDLSNPIETAMIWARDGNSFVCSVVLPNGQDSYNKMELYPAYYESAVTTVQMQIAKAGYRLASWLDLIAGNSTAAAYEGSIPKEEPSDGKADSVGRPRLTTEQREKMALAEDDCGCGRVHESL